MTAAWRSSQANAFSRHCPPRESRLLRIGHCLSETWAVRKHFLVRCSVLVKPKFQHTIRAGRLAVPLFHIGLAIACFLFSGICAEAGDLPILTRVEEVRRLTMEEANRGYPVRLDAVVT